MAVDAGPAVMSRVECEALAKHVLDLLPGALPAEVTVLDNVTATTSFARGDAHLVTETRAVQVGITIMGCGVTTTRLDDAGLTRAIEAAQRAAKELDFASGTWKQKGPIVYPEGPPIYFDSVAAAMTREARAKLFTQALDATEAAGLIGAGDLIFSLQARLKLNPQGYFGYERSSFGEFSLTARTPDGTGSGWGWGGYEDWSRVQHAQVIARAVDMAQRSSRPVAVEPGRYTVILEPNAVADLFGGTNWNAQFADAGWTEFSRDPIGTNKIGLQMMDRDLHVVADPWDSEMPQGVIGPDDYPTEKIHWFEGGILKDLYYEPGYARRKHRDFNSPPPGYRLYATNRPAQTLEEMIASTTRGIWVNRLSGVGGMNGRTGLKTGTTRDGTFLIERGKITKAIKNFRFTESPFFVFNKLEAVGVPVRASRGIVAPRLKVRDFDFTSLTDAI